MSLTVAQTIAKATSHLLEKRDGLVLGQCLTAVGWVGGTVPELPDHPGLVELSMADVAGGGIAVGSALGGRRPTVYIVRYQGFLWYNAISVVNYAAKSWELWRVPCPLLVRAIAMEGSIGPVAGNYHHSLLLRTPGVNVVCPMTPREWQDAWQWHWDGQKTPTVISEHRLSFGQMDETPPVIRKNSHVTVLAIGTARIGASVATEMAGKEGLRASLFHQVWLSPLAWPDGLLDSLRESRRCLIVDADYVEWSTASTLAMKLYKLGATEVECLGLEPRSAGFSDTTDNKSPSPSRILAAMKAFAS